MMRRFMILFAMLFAWLHTAQAGGFMIGEMATRSAGMASAFTAVADDASAAWHNPAGVAFTSGKQLMLGSAVILTSGDYASNGFTTGAGGVPVVGSVNAKDGTFFIPHTYFTYWDEGSQLGASLSINSPFGLETDWPNTAPFATKNTFSRINMIMFNPSLIFKVTDHFSIAAGVDYAYVNKIDLNNTTQDLHGSGDGFGGNVSLLYKSDVFNFGINYRSRIKADINGTATAVAGGALAAFGATSTAATTSVTLPDQINVGLAFMPDDQWTLSFDIDWVNWKTYDSIDIVYSSAAYSAVVAGIQGAVGAPITGQTSLPQNWKATVALRVGAEWEYTPQMRFRAGYIYDPTPIEDVDFSPSVPGNDRHIFSLGYGYDMSPATTIDLAYAYVYIKDRDQIKSPATPLGAPNSVKNGAYKGNAHVLMASVNYHF